MLDEVRIWNVARTGAQIAASRDQELTSGTGLVARYGLNEGTGTTVANSIAGGVNGTAVNGPLWVAGFPLARQHAAGRPDRPQRRRRGNGLVSLSWTRSTRARPGRLPRLPRDQPARRHDRQRPGRRGAHHRHRATSTGPPSTAPPTSTSWSPSTPPATARRPPPAASATPSVAAGSALDFDGTNDHVTFGTAAGLGATSFTLETWFRRDGAGVGATTGTRRHPERHPAGDQGPRRGRDARPTSTSTTSWASTPRPACWWPTSRTPRPAPNHPVTRHHRRAQQHVWHHAAVTYDTATDTWKLYLDGVLERTLVPRAATSRPKSASIQHAALGTSLNSHRRRRRLLQRRARRGPHLERRPHAVPRSRPTATRS